MAHVRQQLRDAVAASLAGIAEVTGRIYINRGAPVSVSKGASLQIKLQDEEISLLTPAAPTRYKRRPVVVIEIIAGGAEQSDLVDAISVQVETAIEAAGLLGGLVKRPLYLVASKTEFDDLVSPPVGHLYLAYQAEIHTAAANPETPI